MKRKVIQIANSTQLVSLPRAWAKLHGIKKGDELEIDESGGKLIINGPGQATDQAAEIDATGLDRTSIVLLLRGLYKKGYTQIKIICNNPVLPHYRTGEKRTFLNVVHSEVNRLPGMEVIQQRENYCVIKAISEPTPKDLDTVIRRVLLLINDVSRDLIDAGKKFDKTLLETVEEKHDTITKFTSYCQRLLYKHPPEHQSSLMIIISLLDKITDNIKNAARLMIKNHKRIRPEALAIMEQVHLSSALYQKLHVKVDYGIINALSQTKEDVIEKLLENLTKISREEAVIINTLQASLELYRGMVEVRVAMEVFKPFTPTAL
ncbi:phosphate uptake regulator PhoU [Candidatus Woesearchaeota archaeon]|nr:phosphate uptake regulator PhoU [Candidatus Woesearchaeota archaeon]